MRLRRTVQWSLAPIVIVVIGLGWKYPLLGFAVPAVMLAGVVGALFRGRYVCGNLCPRGGFFDRIVAPLSRKKPIPNWLRSTALRWTILAALMGFMVFRILQNPGDIRHWGRVFWLVCVITTAAGVVFGVLIHPRVWCAVCPSGTVQNALGGGKGRLSIDAGLCVECGKCERVCPFALLIRQDRDRGALQSRDCLKCGECITACPKDALGWPQAGQQEAPSRRRPREADRVQRDAV